MTTSSHLVPPRPHFVPDEVTQARDDLVPRPRPGPLGEGPDGDEVTRPVRDPHAKITNRSTSSRHRGPRP